VNDPAPEEQPAVNDPAPGAAGVSTRDLVVLTRSQEPEARSQKPEARSEEAGARRQEAGGRSGHGTTSEKGATEQRARSGELAGSADGTLLKGHSHL
jgi:hypothetical protein